MVPALSYSKTRGVVPQAIRDAVWKFERGQEQTVGGEGRGLIYTKSHCELGSGVQGSNEFIMKGPLKGIEGQIG